jgi:uncharacterized protein (TIRG00374 family)
VARLLDPRLGVGLVVTAAALWFAFRGVDFAQLGRDVARANLWVLILPSVPAYLWTLYVRALRWQHLIGGVGEASTGALFRATSVGFMVNNVFPLRMGELVRAWQLARESKMSATAVFGTVVVERVIDAVVILGIAAFVLGNQVDVALFGWLALLPVGVIVWLRLRPAPLLDLADRLSHALLPNSLAERGMDLARQLAAGLAGIRGPRELAWVGFHSAVLWLVAGALPFWAALVALDIDLGNAWQMYMASLAILAGVGIAVGLPSAPGFFGVYHAACVVVLTPLGVSRELALALGALAHGVFWLSIIAFGLIALRSGGGHLEMESAASEAASRD